MTQHMPSAERVLAACACIGAGGTRGPKPRRCLLFATFDDARMAETRRRTRKIVARRVALAAQIFVLSATGGSAFAADAQGWQPTQSFHDLVALAWDRLPQRQEFSARQSVAAARFRAGGALLPDAPSVTGTYVNDKALGSNYNYLTAQLEASTPVWLPGEGTATQRSAYAEAIAAEAGVDAAHLALAAQLLDLAAQAIDAANARGVAERRLGTAQSLALDLSRRLRVGEASQSDQLAAEADAANAAITLARAMSDLAASRAALAEVTGTHALPRLEAPVAADPGPAADPLAHHPRVVAAERAVAAAEANARLVRLQNREDPQLGLQGINEKQPGSRWDTRVGVVLRFSFATEARNAPKRAVAEQATTQAMVQLAVARREVQVQLRQAQAMLAGAELSDAYAARAADALERRRGQVGRAWRLGEMSLIEVVRADASAFDAAFARDKAHTDLAASRLRLLLANGIVP